MKLPIISLPSCMFDRYPFGMQMGNRSYTSGSKGYRYGFNGMERDDEIKGEGNSLDFGARVYDSRLGRWLSLDPFAMSYPSFSDYSFGGNSVILFVDEAGKKIKIYYQDERGRKQKVVLSGTGNYDIRRAYIESNGNKFVEQALVAIHGFSEADLEVADGMMNRVATARRSIKIKEAPGPMRAINEYASDRNTVWWDPEQGYYTRNDPVDATDLITADGTSWPASILYHEIGHGYRDLFEPLKTFFDHLVKHPKYRNKNEQAVQLRFERPTNSWLRKHGWTGTGVRNNNGGSKVPSKMEVTPDGSSLPTKYFKETDGELETQLNDELQLPVLLGSESGSKEK